MVSWFLMSYNHKKMLRDQMKEWEKKKTPTITKCLFFTLRHQFNLYVKTLYLFFFYYYLFDTRPELLVLYFII